LKILIDPGAGFCPGVKRVIRLAEKLLSSHGKVYSTGELIHNRVENGRLEKRGLQLIDLTNLKNNSPVADSSKLLIRAHGEPPSTFEKARNNGLAWVDGTCPIVKRSQKLARSYLKKGYQVAIIGKPGHPEVLGIVGYCQGEAKVIYQIKDLEILNPDKKTYVIAQTTIAREYFQKFINLLENMGFNITVQDTTCGFISRREQEITDFAKQCDLVILVGGKQSSNTKVLYENCKLTNPQSYWIETPDELQESWLKGKNTIGITGSASTPSWLIENIKNRILQK
jgi:4-hydroxy-3-methylbut-2-enyl diphosphate reductase